MAIDAERRPSLGNRSLPATTLSFLSSRRQEGSAVTLRSTQIYRSTSLHKSVILRACDFYRQASHPDVLQTLGKTVILSHTFYLMERPAPRPDIPSLSARQPCVSPCEPPSLYFVIPTAGEGPAVHFTSNQLQLEAPPSPIVILRACDFFDLPVLLHTPTGCFSTFSTKPSSCPATSEAPRRSVAHRWA